MENIKSKIEDFIDSLDVIIHDLSSVVSSIEDLLEDEEEKDNDQ